MQFTSPIDREICQAAFGKVQRGIAYFRQQVQAAIESRLHDAVVHEVLALADAMEQEVIAAVTGAGIQADGVSYNRAHCSQVMPAAALCGGESPERGSYESMRQALQDTQRRCANLLANIYKESEVNRALSKAKAKAEACSKKLTEQVSQQTEEINRLAQTISAQEQLEEARKKTRIEVNLREKDFQRKLAAARKDADDRCNALQESLVNKLHSTRRAAEKVKKDFDQLREDYEDSRKAVHILNEVMSQLIGQTEMTISHRMEALVKSSIEQRVSSTDAARALEETEQLRADQAQSGSFCARLAEARTDAAQSETQRRTFREQRRASAKGMGALQQQLESRIQRLQRHTEELRGELQPGCANCSASFAAPDTLFCHRCGQKRAAALGTIARMWMEVPTPERQSAHLSDESRSFDGRRLEHTLLGVA